eukprot:gene6169-biopygen20829
MEIRAREARPGKILFTQKWQNVQKWAREARPGNLLFFAPGNAGEGLRIIESLIIEASRGRPDPDPGLRHKAIMRGGGLPGTKSKPCPSLPAAGANGGGGRRRRAAAAAAAAGGDGRRLGWLDLAWFGLVWFGEPDGRRRRRWTLLSTAPGKVEHVSNHEKTSGLAPQAPEKCKMPPETRGRITNRCRRRRGILNSGTYSPKQLVFFL